MKCCSNCRQQIEYDGIVWGVAVKAKEIRNFAFSDSSLLATAAREMFHKDMVLCLRCASAAISAMDRALEEAQEGDSDD